jgi:starch synthase
MRILMVGSEAQPFAKTGGLADVLGSLPHALARLGHQVDLVMPRYRGSTQGVRTDSDEVPLGGQVLTADVYAAYDDGVGLHFIDNPQYFDREYLYGIGSQDYADNAERFAFFSQAALQLASRPPGYDVVHAHDWQTGLVPVLAARMFRSGQVRQRIPTVFTIHNLAYQGVFDASWLLRLGLGWDLMRLDALEYWNRISYLKGGIVFSRLVTTVSPTYAREIQTPELGFGFDGILRDRAADLIGILNGIDYDRWNPSGDPYLPAAFDASRLEGKAVAKREVLARFGFTVDDTVMARPLVGMISRLVDQKGFDLLAALADQLPRLEATFVLLGTGERHYEDLWLALSARYGERISARIGLDEGLAHLVEAGADLFLMPSRFEPCGLNQMYSLRYGTVPLVRATGGLADTVRNFDARTGEGAGFTFDQYSPQALLGTLRWALGVFQDRGAWRRMQRAGMREDNSWDASARAYEAAYRRIAVHSVWA